MKRLKIIALVLAASLGASQAQAWNAPVWLAQAWGFMKKHPVIALVSATTISICTLAAITAHKKYMAYKTREKRINSICINELMPNQNENLIITLKEVDKKETDKQFDHNNNIKHPWRYIDATKREQAEREKFFKQNCSLLENDFEQELQNIKIQNINYRGGDLFKYYNANYPFRFFSNTRKDVFDDFSLIPTPSKRLQFFPESSVYDLNHEKKDLYCAYDRIDNGKNLHNNEKYSLDQLCRRQNEVIEALAHTYKIHLQIKPEYLIRVTKELLRFMTTHEYGKYIYQIKVTKSFTKNLFIPRDKDTPLPDPLPTIIVYLPLIPGTMNEKNNLIADILNAIINHFKQSDLKNDFEKMALGLTPRFNAQINEFIYLAQGDGDDKDLYKNALNGPTKKDMCSDIYTKNLEFFKNYEFDMRLIKK